MVQKLNLNLEQIAQAPVSEKEKKERESFWSKFFKKDKIKKADQAAVLFLRDNAVGEPLIVNPKDGMFEFAGKPYHVRTDCKYIMMIGKDKIPLMVVRECDLKPIGNKDWDDLPIERKLSELQIMTIKGIRTAEIVRADGGGKKMDTKTVVILIILGIVALAFLQNYI